MLIKLDENTEPYARLRAFIELGVEELELVARYGCPVGGLCQELGKQGGPLADQAAKLLHDVLNWTEKQFKSLGFGERSEEIALNLVSSMQGMHLLTHTFKEPKLAHRQTKTLLTWLDSLIASKKSHVGSSHSAEAMA